PCRVTFATPVMHGHPCYEVSLDDGSTLVADADHQWFAHDSRDDTARVVTTQQMADAAPAPGCVPERNGGCVPERNGGCVPERNGGCVPERSSCWSIPLAKPLDLPDADLPIDPYAMGGWLAAGTSTPTPVSSSDTRSSRPAEKHIPTPYLRASVKQRIALLEGIVDAASGVPERFGTVELSLGDRRLLGEVHELVASLGYKPGPIRTRSVLLPGGRLGRTWWFSWTTLETPRPTRAVTAVRPVASVPVRCITVDSPSHLYLAGRSFVPTHNTSFALGIVAHAAVESRTPVLLFSLEMSHLELTQRMLCAEARVDATRMRNGRLLETDWPKISHAVGRLAEAPVFIDDNPRLTVMEIRAKARRLKSRAGLGLIVIDYLQLMTGRTSAENRQVEVSEISRGLKILARELQVPVVALSQLSRGLETRADKRPVLADLRESGCMPASTRVLRADTGEEVSLGELVLTQEQPLLWSLDNRWRLVPARVTKVFPSGIRPVFRLRLASGRSVEATGNHPFLTIDGWSRLDALTVGAFVAVPRRLPAPLRERQDWADDDLLLLAHLIGDGTMGPGFTYATGDPANKQLVEDLVSRCLGITSRATRAANTWQLWFPSPYRLGPGVNHPMRNWLEPLGLWRSRAHARYV
ncbi:MAG: DnaB-like helicase C-terminal domain-containing protein, partial [Acidimicrobiales bacterium]